MAFAPPWTCITYLWLSLGSRSPPDTSLTLAPCGRLAAIPLLFDNSAALPWSDHPAGSPPSLNGPQERCLPHDSNPLHCADSCLAAIPRLLPLSHTP